MSNNSGQLKNMSLVKQLGKFLQKVKINFKIKKIKNWFYIKILQKLG